ncbi:hypothetical protein D1007_42453 [Hordeum vulgare]|uniref:Predicted protein n=1 Tax=Hordeum vulgare subsp. vulgare TaxID=112509 RepID=F2DGW9_HORVV|nr:hypothetical protein D1007_42453 [Hordeum vulgare]BAJ94340.1 predicted protein [Hordeum vulgare subsp. vulgare]
MAMMINLRLVSQNIRRCRLRAFALPGLRANAANSFLGCLSLVNIPIFILFLFYFVEFHCIFLCIANDDKFKACFSNIRSCRLRAFALPGLRADAARSFLGCLMQCNSLNNLSFVHYDIFICIICLGLCLASLLLLLFVRVEM